MKTTLTISLAFLFLLQSFTRTFIIVNYQVNKDYISNVLCENKEKKAMHCEGKCHLKKELDKEEKSENTPAGSGKEKFEITLFNESISEFFIHTASKAIYPADYNAILPQNFSFAIFHPPKV
ncbi:MAG: hypothetical protein AB7G44_17465 [Bacteroidia bacterium]